MNYHVIDLVCRSQVIYFGPTDLYEEKTYTVVLLQPNDDLLPTFGLLYVPHATTNFDNFWPKFYCEV